MSVKGNQRSVIGFVDQRTATIADASNEAGVAGEGDALAAVLEAEAEVGLVGVKASEGKEGGDGKCGCLLSLRCIW